MFYHLHGFVISFILETLYCSRSLKSRTIVLLSMLTKKMLLLVIFLFKLNSIHYNENDWLNDDFYFLY
jgi:hypothetical protein